ncbi:hypothetical protein DSO57_1009590 [Entomophthora muscae]|uniref:Uncharacterized protein n=1 Tax=Entomophthora muscae TaxID=34485 RepID=A0ACC2TUI0_9FUNG|nr:hypothetical protein DSO57_1009590 [Entomophthora muscae]
MSHTVRYIMRRLCEHPLCAVRYVGRQGANLGCNTVTSPSKNLHQLVYILDGLPGRVFELMVRCDFLIKSLPFNNVPLPITTLATLPPFVVMVIFLGSFTFKPFLGEPPLRIRFPLCRECRHSPYFNFAFVGLF